MPDPVTKRVKDSLKRVKVRKKNCKRFLQVEWLWSMS